MLRNRWTKTQSLVFVDFNYSKIIIYKKYFWIMSQIKNKTAFSLIELSIVILIIGVIVAGVTQSSRLIGAFRLNTARNLTQSSPVASIPGIFMWFDATSPNAIDVSDPDDAQAVTTLNDLNPQSSTKRNLTQNTAGSKPAYTTGQINNLPVIRFDGSSNDFMTTTLKFSEICPTNQITMFIVGKLRANGATQVLFSLEGTQRISIELSSGVPRFDFVDGSGAGILSGSGSIYNLVTLLTMYKNDTTQTIYKNGAQNATKSNSLTFTDTATNTLYFGRFSTNLQTTIDIGEVIIFDRGLKTEERQAVQNYLGKKWGITIN